MVTPYAGCSNRVKSRHQSFTVASIPPKLSDGDVASAQAKDLTLNCARDIGAANTRISLHFIQATRCTVTTTDFLYPRYNGFNMDLK